MKSLSIYGVVVATVTLGCFSGPLEAQDFVHPTTGTSNFVMSGASHNFYDSGGAGCYDAGGEYSENEDGISIICPSAPGQFVTIEFLEVDVETADNPTACYDFLSIHDGNSTSAPLVFRGCGEEGFPTCPGFPGDGGDCDGVEGGPCDIDGTNDATPWNNVFVSTAADGCLTVEFLSDATVQEGGWVALVTEDTPVELIQFSVD